MYFQSFVVLTHLLVLEMINKTRLTYNCAHLRPNSKKNMTTKKGKGGAEGLQKKEKAEEKESKKKKEMSP